MDRDTVIAMLAEQICEMMWTLPQDRSHHEVRALKKNLADAVKIDASIVGDLRIKVNDFLISQEE